MEDTASPGVLASVFDGIVWFFSNIAMSFYNLAYALTHPQLWLDWSDKQSVMRFAYYGGSTELFFVVLSAILVLLGIGIWRNSIMWGYVRFLEGIANTIGRYAAWAGLIMVIQQIMIVFMGGVFVRPDMIFAFGVPFQKDLSWYGEELKLYNAMIVALCVTYTFIQGGHVRVDLIYAGVKYRTKKIIDMVGSVIFMMPMAVMIWLYSWFFLWRHLIVPKPSASDQLDGLLRKATLMRWNVETIGPSPNGFNGYFLFKILLVAFAGLVFLQAVAFFCRSYLEWKEGEESEGKYVDRDTLGAGEEAYEGTH